MFKELFDIWIVENNGMPAGFLLDTSEEALLLPDWLKLRMLRSHDQQLITAGTKAHLCKKNKCMYIVYHISEQKENRL